MQKLILCNVMLVISFIMALSSTLFYNYAELGNLDLSGGYTNKFTVKLRDTKNSDVPFNSLIVLTVLCAIGLVCNFIIFKFFKSRKVPSFIALMIYIGMLTTSIIGIVYFSRVELVKINNISFDILKTKIGINQNQTNIDTLKALNYTTYALTLFTSLICGGVAISYLANRK
jgi:hypothetical protein